MERSSVSMQDVARAAGVSPQTVSAWRTAATPCVRRRGSASEAAMERLGYRPNYARAALKHGQFKNIGVVLFHMTTFGNARILNGIVEAAEDDGYATTLVTIGHGHVRTLQAIAERMKQLPVDGVIVVLEERIADFDDFEPPKELPFVLVNESAANHCPTIDADQYGCSRPSSTTCSARAQNRLPYHRSVRIAGRSQPRPRLA